MDEAFEMSPLQAYRLAKDLRKFGVNATLERVGLMLEGLSFCRASSVQETYRIGRATLCCSKDDLVAYDRCFLTIVNAGRQSNELKATGGAGLGKSGDVGDSASPQELEHRKERASTLPQGRPLDARTSANVRRTPDTLESDKPETPIGGAGVTGIDVLRHRDVTVLTDAERNEMFKLIEQLLPCEPLRASRRRGPSASGCVDVRRTVRNALSHGGDPDRIYRQRGLRRIRQCIILIDVSGSMTRYSELLLRLGYALVSARPRSTEIFTVGTRLTRLTRLLQTRDPDRALSLAAAAIPDWQGGTRLGDQLKAFLDRWGKRGMARGAVVVIASDGWERGDCKLLIEQMDRLRRIAYRIVWCNPHKSTPGYEPASRGIRAVLPYIDDFVGGASVYDMQQLGITIARERDAEFWRFSTSRARGGWATRIGRWQ